MQNSSLETTQPKTATHSYRHIVMILAGLLFTGSALVSFIAQDWRNLSIALILVV